MSTGGIGTRSRTGTFGSRPWSRRWMIDVEAGAARPEVRRGRMLAREGRVRELRHSGTVVVLRVAGSQPEPFTVRFDFRAPDAGELEALRRAVEDEPEGVTGVLAGRFGDATGFLLVPAVAGRTSWTCDCPAPEHTCAHVVAAAAVLVEWWDAEPGVLPALRGLDGTALGWDERRAQVAGRFALADPWGPVGSLPSAVRPAPAAAPEVLDQPVARRLGAAASNDPLEALRVISDLEDAYHAFAQLPEPPEQPGTLHPGDATDGGTG